MSELQIEHYHYGESTIIIYGSGDTYYKIETYEVEDENTKA